MSEKIPYKSKIPNLADVIDSIILAGEKIQEIYETDFDDFGFCVAHTNVVQENS